MIIAVTIVLVVQVAIHQVIHMVAMRNRLVSTAWAVHMVRIVPFTLMSGSTVRRITIGNLDGVLVYMITMGMVQMAIVKVIGMVTVLDGSVPAVGSMDVVVIRMFFTAHVGLLINVLSKHRCNRGYKS